MQISVVIPTHNRAEILRMCLDRLALQKGVDFEVIVVDDGSTDNTQKVLKEVNATFPKRHGYDTFRHYKQKASHQGTARNLGASQAKGDIIVFIGDDILVEPGFLEKHYEIHYEYTEENLAVLGFTVWDPALEINDYMRFLEISGWQFGYGKLEAGLIQQVEPYKYFYASNLSLKKSLFNKEKFNEIFRAYGWEDIELGYRLWKNHKMRLYYEPRAIGLHHHFVDPMELPRRMESIGQSAVVFERLQPDVKIIPRGLKRRLIQLATRRPILAFFKVFNNEIYFKLKSWEQFMVGVNKTK